MGVYDIIIAKCPECNTENDFQTKGGECILRTYKIEEAPRNVMYDANRHTPQHCENEKCDKLLFVDIENKKLRVASKKEIKEKEERIEAKIKSYKSLIKN